MTYDIPKLRPPHEMDPIRTQEDVCQTWRALMGKLGFGRTRLWVILIDRDGRMEPHIIQIDESPIMPDTLMIRNLMDVLRDLMRDEVRGGSVAMLWSRPGAAATESTDIAWAKALIAGASRRKLNMWPVHLANDFDLRVFAPDELAA